MAVHRKSSRGSRTCHCIYQNYYPCFCVCVFSPPNWHWVLFCVHDPNDLSSIVPDPRDPWPM